jgi:hypothetical protein
MHQGDQCVAADGDEWIWTLPAARSKNKRPRVTPLVGVARQIVEERLAVVSSGPLFTAGTGATLTAAHVGHCLLARGDKLPISKFTTHDLRRTVATQLAEMAIPLELVAAVIGHEAGGRETRTLVRHYVRTDLLARKKNNAGVLGASPFGNYRRQIADRKTCLFSKWPRSVSFLVPMLSLRQWARGAIHYFPTESEPRSRA